MRILLMAAAAVVLSGCAGVYKTTVASSSERTVVIESILDEPKTSQKLADTECAKYQRVARLTGPARNYRLIYDCVL